MELLEGRQSVLAALLARRRKFQMVLLRQGIHTDKIEQIVQLAEEMNIPCRFAPAEELSALAHGGTHGGVLALAQAKPKTTVCELMDLLDKLTVPPLLLLLEGIEDARNLGFVLRSAEALGVHAVLIKKHLWDLDAVEIARPSSGAYERMPLVQLEDVAPLLQLRKRGLQLIGCLAAAKRPMDQVDMTLPTILAVGGEKRGLSGAVREHCDRLAHIPATSPAGSLSLSHATAILMAEAQRQRLASQLSGDLPGNH